MRGGLIPLKSRTHESVGAEQGCGGQDIVDIPHSQGLQESELSQWHVTHKTQITVQATCITGAIEF